MAQADRAKLAQAKRWHGRKQGCRTRRDELRCHEIAMQKMYDALGWGEYKTTEQARLL